MLDDLPTDDPTGERAALAPRAETQHDLDLRRPDAMAARTSDDELGPLAMLADREQHAVEIAGAPLPGLPPPALLDATRDDYDARLDPTAEGYEPGAARKLLVERWLADPTAMPDLDDADDAG